MDACACQGQTSCNCVRSGQETSEHSHAIQHHRVQLTMNEGEEDVPFTPEQIQWIDRLIAS